MRERLPSSARHPCGVNRLSSSTRHHCGRAPEGRGGERDDGRSQRAPSRNRAHDLGSPGVAALGVVFGDIGTSPLYTLKTVLDYTGPHPDAGATLGALSLIVWTLFLITTVKYVNFAMRIDNDGEGGIIALMTLLGVKTASAAVDRRRRPVRRGADLRRRRDHAGDLGALGARGRGTDRARACRPTCCRPRRSILLALVRDPAVRDGADRARLRADHARSGSSSLPRSASTASCSIRRVFAALNPLYGARLSAARRLHRLSGARRRVPVRDRRRGALRRHGPFRRQTDPAGLVLSSSSRPDPQLRRPGGDRARRRADRRQHLLPALPAAAADAADRARDRRHDHRQPVDHHRRLLDDPAGDPARLAAAHAHHADLRGGLRPDLCRRGQLAADDRDARPDASASASPTISPPPTASRCRRRC